MKLKTTILLCSVCTCAWAQHVNPIKVNPIKVNQVGYYPDQEKTATVEREAITGTYTLTDARTGKRVWSGKAIRTVENKDTKRKRAVVDFSAVKTPGEYVLNAKGKAKQTVVIKENALSDVAKAVMQSFYLQRVSVPILEKHAGIYARPAAHADNHVLVHPSAASLTRPAGTVIMSEGGWYDAGDFGKYVVNSAYSIGIMLNAYEQNPEYFNKVELNIPEAGNASPDFLDEIMVNLRWMQTMQDPADGGVYHKMTTPSFEAFIMPAEAKQQRYVVMKTTAATYDFAAVMAQAARIYKNIPGYEAWAEIALGQAKAAYDWANRHPEVYYRQNEMNKKFKPAVTTGAYDDENVNDEHSWAAAELAITTGDASYAAQSNKAIREFKLPTWGFVEGLEFYSRLNSTKGKYLKAALTGYADKCVEALKTSAFDSPFGTVAEDFGWGCIGEHAAGMGFALVSAYRLTGDAQYLAAAIKCADYVLGRNATGYSFITGYGSQRVMHPHQRISSADGIVDPLPGFVSGGPNPGQQDRATCNTYTSSIPDESFTDDMNSYASNEIAINWNATMVAFMWSLDDVLKQQK